MCWYGEIFVHPHKEKFEKVDQIPSNAVKTLNFMDSKGQKNELLITEFLDEIKPLKYVKYRKLNYSMHPECGCDICLEIY